MMDDDTTILCHHQATHHETNAEIDNQTEQANSRRSRSAISRHHISKHTNRIMKVGKQRKRNADIIIGSYPNIVYPKMPAPQSHPVTRQSTYCLTYFTFRGRGEVMRQLFAWAGQDYEDRRLEGEQWRRVKSKAPFRQLPLLEVDGKVICQSNAGSRYLAKRFGLHGNSDWESAEVDMVVDCVEDLIRPVITMEYNENEEEKAEEREHLEKIIPGQLEALESILGEKEYYVGDKLTLADIHAAHYLGYLEVLYVDRSKYPKVFQHIIRVQNEPRIKDWIDKRPNTQF